MDTQDHAGDDASPLVGVRHAYLQRERASAHQAFCLAFYTELIEYDLYEFQRWDGWDDGEYLDAFTSQELAQAFKKGNGAYASSLLRSGRIR